MEAIALLPENHCSSLKKGSMKHNPEKKPSMVQFIMMCLLLPVIGFAQPDYDFTNGSLESGTDRQVGAIYRFATVRAGVDALVYITSISPGVTVSEMDGASGYPEALQPTLKIDAWTTGYLEMRIDFVTAGTSTLMNQGRIPITCIDVDGIANFDGLGNGVHEFDEVDMGGGYMNYDLLGTELSMGQYGNVFMGINQGGIDYPGRDTSARQVMFTVVNVNISSAIIRVGVHNQSANSAVRLRSVYFKDFWYANGLLPVSGLLQFTGSAKDDAVMLKWELSTLNTYVSVTVERSKDGISFNAIGSGNLLQGKPLLYDAFKDALFTDGTMFYRLRLLDRNGATSYSRILLIKGTREAGEGLRIYPNLVESTASLSLYADRGSMAQYALVDMSGRPVRQASIQLYAGQNSIQLNGLESLRKGTYVLIVTANGERRTAKMIRQ